MEPNKNIKTNLLMVILGTFAIYVPLALFIYANLQAFNSAQTKAIVAEEISQTIFENKILAEDFILNNSVRAANQWLERNEEISQRVNATKHLFVDPDQSELIQRIEISITESREVFNLIQKTYSEEGNAETNELMSEKIDRLSSRLSVRSQEAASSASVLVELNNQILLASSQNSVLLFVGSSVLLLLLLGGSFGIIWKIITEYYKQASKEQAILKGIGDGVIAIDLDWKIISFNEAAALITGWSNSEALGKNFKEVIKFIREHDRKENIDFISKAMFTGKSVPMDNHTLLITKGGKEVPVGDSAAPVLDDSGNVSGAVIIFRDVTQEQEANMLRSDFANASHQFRTPITKIKWTLEEVLEDIENSKVKTAIEDSLNALQSLNKLSDKLLAISQVDQDQIIPALETCSLSQVIGSAIAKVGPLAESKKVKLETSEVSDFTLKTDPQLLELALLELLANAVLYNNSDGQVSVDTAEQEEGYLITIHDNGIGIPQQEHPLMFKKFLRGSNFDTSSIAGAGVGLFLAKSYLTLLKGRIWFISKEGAGSTFYIMLPRNV